MIKIKVGNMLEQVTSGFIVQGCNAQGLMGSGIAKAIRAKWPLVYEDYRQIYTLSGLELGQVYTTDISDGQLELLMLNAITQEFYGANGRRYVNYEAIYKAFERINALAQLASAKGKNITINFPLIGAGLGGGNWKIISTIIDETISDKFEKILWVLTESDIPK